MLLPDLKLGTMIPMGVEAKVVGDGRKKEEVDAVSKAYAMTGSDQHKSSNKKDNHSMYHRS